MTFAPWPVIRFELFRAYSQQAGIFDWTKGDTKRLGQPARFEGVSGSDHLLSMLGLRKPEKKKLFGDKGYALADGLLSAENIVLPFGRRGSNGEDKFTDFLSVELKRDVAILGNGSVDASRGCPTFQAMRKFALKYFGAEQLELLISAVSAEDIARYDIVILRVRALLGIEVEELSDFPMTFFSEFLAEYRIWNLFFQKSKASRLFMPISQLALIGAARANGVRVIEIQHGLFNPYPMRFNWPGNPEVDYLPDEIWTWGEYWTRGFDLPAGQVVKVLGKNVDLVKAMGRKYTKKPGQVAFISQPAAWRELLDAAAITAKASPCRSVVFRNHPGHDNSEVLELVSKLGLPNLTLSPQEEGILNLLGESEVVVGAFSTTLIEAVALGTPVVILQVSSWMRLKGLIDSGNAVLAATLADVPAAIEKTQIVSEPSYFYAEPTPLKKLLK